MKRAQTILVVDDEKTIADGLRMTLESEGYGVRTAGSVREALGALVQGDPHAAIVDLMLPDGDGLQLTRELKRRDPALEVLVITAYGSVRKAMEATKGAGAFHVLEKPFEPDELLGLLENALEHRKLAASERRALIIDALERTGLSDFADAFPKQLSGGMRQRVGIARALAVRPALLLMDEPLSALDAQTRELLIEDLMGLLDGTELAVLYVTHNLDEALRLADRIIVLSPRPGRILDIVAIPISRRARNEPAFETSLRAIHARLWSLVREGALAAEREVADA